MTKLSEMPTESTFDWSSWDGWDDNSTFDLEQPEESQIINYDKLEYLDENNIFFYYKRATTEEDIKKLLTKPEVIKYLQDYIVYQADYSYYENLFENIDPTYITHIFTEEYIKEYTSKINRFDRYKLFSTMFNQTKKRNRLLDLMLSNEELFKFFSKEYKQMYSAVVLDKEHCLKLIKKIEHDNLYSDFNMLHIEKEFESNLLNEEYSVKTLNWLLDRVSKESKSDFFINDPRATITIPHIKNNLSSYIVHGIKFGDQMIKHPDFFEMLKGPSLLQFRQYINILEDNCNSPHYIETRLQKYYESLIETYNPETKLFSCYDEILSDDEKFYESQSNGYLFNSEIKWENRQDRNKYIDTTNKKLSELIIDYLFQDTIFNVWHNINQMINYMKTLSEKENPVQQSHIKFYELILRIDDIPPEEKISMFHKLKNKNINLTFYDDMRAIKDLAYSKINEQMIDPTNPIYEKTELTEKYGVTVMDLREEKYFMLVRTMHKYYEENSSTRAASSYSLISNENTSTFSNDNIIYGYTNFEIDRVEHMFDFDSFSSAFAGSLNNSQGTTNNVNQILTADKLANSAGYSEVILKNKICAERKFDEMKPNFVVVKNEPTPQDIKAAQLLNVPIVIIKENILHGSSHFIIDETEKYTNGNYCEQQYQSNR